jgi:hypothetical protein
MVSTCCFRGHHRRADRLLVQDDFATRLRETSVSGKAFANLGHMQLAAHWTDSYQMAEFRFIWSDKLGLPEYSTVYITLGA